MRPRGRESERSVSMEWESCQNLVSELNVFRKRGKTCFASKAKRVSQARQNVFHSLSTIYKLSVVCKETYLQLQNNILQVRNSTLSSTKQFYKSEKLSRHFWHDLTACHVTFGSNFPLCRSLRKGKIICAQMPVIRTHNNWWCRAPGSRVNLPSAVNFQAAQPSHPPSELFCFYCKLLFEVS